MPDPIPTRIIVAITGASGAVLGIRALERLRSLNIEPHLVISAAAAITLAYSFTVTWGLLKLVDKLVEAAVNIMNGEMLVEVPKG